MIESNAGSLALVLGILTSQVEVNLNEQDKPRKFTPNNKPVKKIIPNGCKEYPFTYGNEGKFTCIARKEQTAKNKFKKFLEQLK